MNRILKLALFLVICQVISISAMQDNDNLIIPEVETRRNQEHDIPLAEQKRATEDKEESELKQAAQTETKEREEKVETEAIAPTPEDQIRRFGSLENLAEDLEQGKNPYNQGVSCTSNYSLIENHLFHHKKSLKKLFKKHLIKRQELIKRSTNLSENIINLIQDYYHPSQSPTDVVREFEEYAEFIKSQKSSNEMCAETIDETITEIEKRILKLLQDQQITNEDLKKMLQIAVIHELTDWMEKLIHHGALKDGKANDLLDVATQQEKLVSIQMLLKNKKDTDIDVTKALLQLLDNNTISKNHIEIIAELINAGADVKNTLIKACRIGNIQIIELFINNGANVNRVPTAFDLSPLIFSINKYLSHKERFNELRTSEDRSSLKEAEEATDKYLKIIEILIKNGADAYMKILDVSALDLARGANDINLIRILRQSIMPYPNSALNINNAMGIALQERLDNYQELYNNNYVVRKTKETRAKLENAMTTLRREMTRENFRIFINIMKNQPLQSISVFSLGAFCMIGVFSTLGLKIEKIKKS